MKAPVLRKAIEGKMVRTRFFRGGPALSFINSPKIGSRVKDPCRFGKRFWCFCFFIPVEDDFELELVEFLFSSPTKFLTVARPVE